MKIRILFFAIYLLPLVAYTQKNAIIKFDTTIHDFGKIKEEDGNVRCTFFFTNTGTDTLIVSKVKPGCGCTTADWTKSAVLPGQNGYIKAEFHTQNRGGVFNKSITVTSNATESTKVLFIKGEVIARKRDYKDTFSVVSGNLRLKSNHIAFLELKNNEIKSDTLEFMNDGTVPVSLKPKTSLDFISYVIKPEKLNPKERGMIIFTYDASKKKDWGLVYDYVTVETDDSIEQNKIITLSANLLEDFSGLTEKQRSKAPQLVFTTDTFNFGTIKEGDIATYVFEFSNKGKSNLIIRKIKPSCGCTTTKITGNETKKIKNQTTGTNPVEYIYKKGKGGTLEVIFNAAGRKGDEVKTVSIISNDPEHPTITLFIKGKVEPKK